jgi:hypothetical protein
MLMPLYRPPYCRSYSFAQALQQKALNHFRRLRSASTACLRAP